jgi:hypothetical protein
MGFDWESILGTTGTGLDDACDAAVSAVMYPDKPAAEARRPFPVGERTTTRTARTLDGGLTRTDPRDRDLWRRHDGAATGHGRP